MQDRYVGDIGDYGKLGLLRSLAAAGLLIGVNWYRTPDENHNEDGKFIQYLRTSGEGSYRSHDPVSYTHLDVYKRHLLHHGLCHAGVRADSGGHGPGHFLHNQKK